MSTIRDLETKGLVDIKYPTDLRIAVKETVEAWKKFTTLPLETKKGLPYSNGGAGIGYEFKVGEGHKADRKENFDVTIQGLDWFDNNSSNISEPLARDFIERAVGLIDIMKPTIVDFAQQVEAEFGLEGFVDEVAASETGFFVRFIHYFGDRQLGDETATAHVDQSGFTLHLYESAPGLQRMTYDGKWVDMPVSEGETAIINAMQMQLRSKGRLRALAHRVIATPETAVTGRFSAVCFVQLKNTAKYDKVRCGRLQEKAPGFNYRMDIDEFAQMFND